MIFFKNQLKLFSYEKIDFILYSVIGLAVALFARGIVAFITTLWVLDKKNVIMDLSKLNKDLKPFFSIAIPTYGYNGKGAEFLNFSLDLLSKQNFKDFEVILSDHSTDNTIKNVYTDWKSKLKSEVYK